MATQESIVHSRIAARDVRSLDFQKVEDYNDLAALGIGGLHEYFKHPAYAATGMDAAGQPLVTTPGIPVPAQFLQNWLPGQVYVITAARNIDDLIGITTVGSWADEEIVQTIVEQTGKPLPYSDVASVPESSWNTNFETRTVVRFEEGFQVGPLELARTSRININSADQKRIGAGEALEIERNRVGFYGYNNGLNKTYGFLNDPNLPAYVNNPGPAWSGATFLEITGDIRAAIVGLRTQSKDRIDPKKVPLTLAVASSCVDYLSVTNTLGSQSVMQWLNQTYPNIRVVSAPELDLANGGANVFYLYADRVADKSTDGGAVWEQVVPAKFQVTGVQQLIKGYAEAFVNATAGALLKRPYAVYRMSGI